MQPPDLHPAAERFRWQRLSWTVAALALAVAPHAVHLPPWVLLFAAVLGMWRLNAERPGWKLPPATLRLGLAFGGLLAVLASYRTINGIDAGTALLVVMMSLKLIETRSRRDHAVLIFIGFFLIVATALYMQSIWTIAIIVPSTWLMTATLLQVSRSRQALPGAASLRVAGTLLLQSVPVMVLLFVLFPRIPGPFWALPARGGGGATGLSDEMSPGSITKLSMSEKVAFRARFEDRVPSPSERYWRGPVLHNFDGRTWSGATSFGAPEDAVQARGPALRYELTLEAHERQWLFALDMPAAWTQPDAYLNRDLQLISRRPVNERIAYRVESWPEYIADRRLASWQRRRDLQIPNRSNPEARELAERLLAQSSSPWAFVERILQMFNEQPYVYTLEPPPLGREPVDDFLFATRRGFCEHYASAFTFLMRAAGIPARVVTGYQGGELNPLGDYFIVRQSDAHAWSEVWLEGQGWIRVDPTAAVAPERIERGLAQAMQGREAVPGAMIRNSKLLRQLRLSWDAVNTAWNDWVLGYGPEKQAALLSRLGMANPDWQKMIAALTVLLGAAMVGFSVFLAWRYRPRPADAAARAYARFCAKLARCDLDRSPHEGPLDFAQRVAAQRPELAAAADAITRRYIDLRYGTLEGAEELRTLRRMIGRLRV